MISQSSASRHSQSQGDSAISMTTLTRSTAPTWSFDMIEESIQNLISNYVENQDTEYLHYLDSRPIEPSVQKEQQMKRVVAEIGELDDSIGSIRGH